MATTTAQTPFQWLQDLERRARQRAKGLPRQEKVQEIWRGIAYRMGENYLVTAISDIREVLTYPTQLARVPGAKTWVKGLANIRGLLLPIIDLQSCLEGRATVVESRSRILVINLSGVFAGLLVDEVLGIKHFPEQLRDLETPCKIVWIAPFAKGLFTYEDNAWTVFDVKILIESELFLRASL